MSSYRPFTARGNCFCTFLFLHLPSWFNKCLSDSDGHGAKDTAEKYMPVSQANKQIYQKTKNKNNILPNTYTYTNTCHVSSKLKSDKKNVHADIDLCRT